MSRTDANTEKTAGPLQNVARPDNLHWAVFVTPGLPGSSNRPTIHPRFRSINGNDKNRPGAVRQDAGVTSEPGQSRMGAMEISTRSQALSPETAETPPKS